MDLHEYLNQFAEPVVMGRKLNQYRAHPKSYEFTDMDVSEYNEIYQTLKKSDLYTIERTASGAIGVGYGHRHNYYAWDCINTKTTSRITVSLDGCLWVFRVGHLTVEDKGKKISPAMAWITFNKECLNDGIDLEDYKISKEEGQEVKKKIPMPLIKMEKHMTEDEEGLKDCHHIDFHNSYPGGLINSHPEFRATIERLYAKRKDNPEYKAVLNYSIGCMQSTKSPWSCQWAHLAKDAITDNNDRVLNLACSLIFSDRKIIGFNTDGIWYQGNVFHGKGEGKGVGQWENDHTNCIFRSKSDGAYEYIENGVYNAVIRGATSLDKEKPRTEWEWGDIYRCSIIEFTFDDERGIVLC